MIKREDPSNLFDDDDDGDGDGDQTIRLEAELSSTSHSQDVYFQELSSCYLACSMKIEDWRNKIDFEVKEALKTNNNEEEEEKKKPSRSSSSRRSRKNYSFDDDDETPSSSSVGRNHIEIKNQKISKLLNFVMV